MIWWIWISKLKWPSPIELGHTNTKHQRSIHTKIQCTTKGENFLLELNIFILSKHVYLGSDVQKELYQWEFYKTLPTLGVDESCAMSLWKRPQNWLFWINVFSQSMKWEYLEIFMYNRTEKTCLKRKI